MLFILYCLPSVLMTLLVEREEGHVACKDDYLFADSGELSGTLHILELQLVSTPSSSSLAAEIFTIV